MGMYTGLRGKVTLTEDVVTFMREYYESDVLWKIYDSVWEYVKVQTGLDLKGFESDYRCGYIPSGAVCYMPEEWGDNDWMFAGNTLYFTCSLKNYTGTIQKFIDILPIIAIDWDLEKLYEEDTESTFYKSGETNE